MAVDLAVFLVAVLNYYAMVGTDIVDMDELIEYKNEVVKVEGVISWRKTRGIQEIGKLT